jgi:hypothetical protein
MAQVRVIKKWDGNRPNINLLLGTFCAYLTDQRIKEQKAIVKISTPAHSANTTIQWIEQLLYTPICDHRKFAVWRILAPYLINVKGLSSEGAFSIIEEWLERCNQQSRLSFSPKSKIREGIKGTAKGYRPISYEKLKIENNELYEKINGKQGLISC